MTNRMTSDEAYDKAKADPVAAVVLEALHDQDARTYHGQSGDIGALALGAAERVRQVVGIEERYRMAQLIEDNAVTLAGFAKDQDHLLMLVAFMLRLGTGEIGRFYSRAADSDGGLPARTERDVNEPS